LVPAFVALTLTGAFSEIAFEPSRLDFGTPQLGSAARLQVRLANQGATDFHGASIVVEGTDAKDFQVDAQPCATIAARETCTLWVDFRPQNVGVKHARLIVRANDGTEFSIDLQGAAWLVLPQPSPAKDLPPPPLPDKTPLPSGSSPPQAHTNFPPPVTPPAKPQTLPQMPSHASPPPPSPDDQLQHVVDELPLGNMVFNHPQEMRLGKQEYVYVRISQDLAHDLAQGLSTQGVTERDQIKVSTSMRVRLSGDPYFDVKGLTDKQQLVTKKDYTEWKFTVLPLKRGTWPLHLTITAVVRTPWGTEVFKDYPVKDEFVQVRVTAFGVVSSFIGGNWQWFLSAILIPLAVWIWRKRAELKKKTVAVATRSGSRRR
jgi:hypothetical protein